MQEARRIHDTTPHHTTPQVWNANAEQKKVSTGDGYMTSCNRAALVPDAANVLREQGHPEMASILDNTTEGARKVRGEEAASDRASLESNE